MPVILVNYIFYVKLLYILLVILLKEIVKFNNVNAYLVDFYSLYFFQLPYKITGV
jgi:hypothetical protein